MEGSPIGYYLLFTDGLNTIGNALPEMFPAPVYVFASAEIVNTALLKMWAKKSGGMYWRLSKGDTSQVQSPYYGDSPYRTRI